MPTAIRAVTILGVATLLLVSPAGADAACGGGGGDEVTARFVRNRADTIVLARVGEQSESGLITLHVIERYRGDVGATIELDDESLPCRSFSDSAGDRVLVATGTAKPDDYLMPPAEPRRWWIAWFHYPGFGWQSGMTDRYRGLDSLLAAIDLLPPTASESVHEDAGPNEASLLLGSGFAAWILFALGWRRRSSRLNGEDRGASIPAAI